MNGNLCFRRFEGQRYLLTSSLQQASVPWNGFEHRGDRLDQFPPLEPKYNFKLFISIKNKHAIVKQDRRAASTPPKHRETIIQENQTILVADWIAYRYPYRGESERERAREREREREREKTRGVVRERESKYEGWREVALEIVRKNERERHRERECRTAKSETEKRDTGENISQRSPIAFWEV